MRRRPCGVASPALAARASSAGRAAVSLRPAGTTRRRSGSGGSLGRRGSLHYKKTRSLAEVAELLGDSKRVAAEHYVYALTDYRDADYLIALARYQACTDELARPIPPSVPSLK